MISHLVINFFKNTTFRHNGYLELFGGLFSNSDENEPSVPNKEQIGVVQRKGEEQEEKEC